MTTIEQLAELEQTKAKLIKQSQGVSEYQQVTHFAPLIAVVEKHINRLKEPKKTKK